MIRAGHVLCSLCCRMRCCASNAMRHNFAIELKGRAGRFKPQRYHYFCIRCRWLFLVEGAAISALADSRKPLTEREGLRRIATFAAGPCPAAPLDDALLERRVSTAAELRRRLPEHSKPRDRSLVTLLLDAILRRPSPEITLAESGEIEIFPRDARSGSAHAGIEHVEFSGFKPGARRRPRSLRNAYRNLKTRI